MFGKEGIDEMVRIKKEIDPYCLFGLDNIFPKSRIKEPIKKEKEEWQKR